MYTQRCPHSAPPYYPHSAGGKDTRRPLPPCPYRSAPISPAISAVDTFDDRTPAWFHEILDSTTLEVGFDQSCLKGLTAELLYTPTDAFAQSCWDILFPEQDPEPEVKTPISGPPSYRTLPDIYIHPGGSTSRSTIRPQSPEERKREKDFNSFIDTASSAFWDESDEDAEDEYEVESQDVKSFVSFDDDESEVSSFSHIDAIKNHPVIDTDFSVKDNLFLSDLSKVEWRPSLMCWEDTLPISVVFREMPVSSKPPKPMSKMAALRAKLPILPFRSAAQV